MMKSLSHAQLLATPWTAAYQAPLSMGFSRQEYWSGVPLPSPELPYDPAIPLLGIHTEETRTERDTCTPMFIAALFIIARTWKRPRCPSADEWIRKLWYIYTMEYYSAIKKKTFESVLMRWMKLKPVIQSEVSQKEKHQYSMLQLLLLSHFSHVRLCATPEMAAHQAPPSLGFSRQEYWSGLPLPSPQYSILMHIYGI